MAHVIVSQGQGDIIKNQADVLATNSIDPTSAMDTTPHDDVTVVSNAILDSSIPDLVFKSTSIAIYTWAAMHTDSPPMPSSSGHISVPKALPPPEEYSLHLYYVLSNPK